MKHLSITLLFAVVCSFGSLQAASLPAPKDTMDRYVIDNSAVDLFDGSQLEGKKIVTYRISMVKSSSKGVVRIHNIKTKGASRSKDPIYVIDGVQVSKNKFENLSPSLIKSLTVIKNGSIKEVRQFPGWENGVILVETKGEEEMADTKDKRVNIGYGEADSRDLSYSVGTVKTDDNEFFTNMFDYLRGRVAGVQVGPDNTIIIRGQNSLYASKEPLILLDGVEITDLNLVNPRDVYSVDVLKDASASIYGIKGANGVILITTKGHQAKEKDEKPQGK